MTNSAVVVETCFKAGGRMGGPRTSHHRIDAPFKVDRCDQHHACGVNVGLESLASRVMYLWHVDVFGRYSLYAGGLTGSVATGFTAALSVAIRE